MYINFCFGTWIGAQAVIFAHASQSSWSNGSSIDTNGYSFKKLQYSSNNLSAGNHVLLSEFGFLKSKSYKPSLKIEINHYQRTNTTEIVEVKKQKSVNTWKIRKPQRPFRFQLYRYNPLSR